MVISLLFPLAHNVDLQQALEDMAALPYHYSAVPCLCILDQNETTRMHGPIAHFPPSVSASALLLMAPSHDIHGRWTSRIANGVFGALHAKTPGKAAEIDRTVFW